MKKIIYSILAISLTLPTLSSPLASAYLTGRTTVNTVTTSSPTPTITGTIPTWCNDVAIVLGTAQGNSYTPFLSDAGQVSLSNGNWSLDLAANGFGLINSVYDIGVVSECGYSGTYADPLYFDVFYGAISIVPGVCDQLCVPVYRFYNTQSGAHFYTTNENEKRDVLTYSQYRFEGISSYAKYFRSPITGMVPVHRFYNLKQGVHFYTSNQAEATNINNTQYTTYRYEGIAYYTYDLQQPSTEPVYRFYKFKQGVHFYTSNQAEATNINNTQYTTYRYEGIAYYNIINQ